MAVLRGIGQLLLVVALLLMAAGIYIWLDGRAEQSLGQVWSQDHVASLNYLQVVVERHLGLSGFWFGSVIPFLSLPAWEALLWVVIALLIVGGVLAAQHRRRQRPSGFG